MLCSFQLVSFSLTEMVTKFFLEWFILQTGPGPSCQVLCHWGPFGASRYYRGASHYRTQHQCSSQKCNGKVTNTCYSIGRRTVESMTPTHFNACTRLGKSLMDVHALHHYSAARAHPEQHELRGTLLKVVLTGSAKYAYQIFLGGPGSLKFTLCR